MMGIGLNRKWARSAVLLGLVGLASGCTWVKMDSGAAAIRVLPLGPQIASCKRLGEIEVSVKARVGPYDRNPVEVRDELETLARNEALTLHADAVQPEVEPRDGGQRWLAYRCNR